MHPILIDLGSHDLPLLGPTHVFLPTYGTIFAIGALLAWWWFLRRARVLGIEHEVAFNLAFYVLLAGLVGAKLALVVVEWRYYLENPRAIVESLRSAGVLMGGVIAGVLALVWYSRRHGLPPLRVLDAIVAPLALAQSTGRLGCFSAGCCYGVPSSSWFSVVFTDPRAAAQTGVPLGTSLVPIQLMQMANDLVLVLVLTWMWRRRLRPEGTVFWWYVLLYSLTRGILELWRGDRVRGVYLDGLLSTSQVIGIAGIVVATFFLVRGRLRRAARAA